MKEAIKRYLALGTWLQWRWYWAIKLESTVREAQVCPYVSVVGKERKLKICENIPRFPWSFFRLRSLSSHLRKLESFVGSAPI